MSFPNLLNRARDVERDVGALNLHLQANDDLERKDFANLAAQVKDSLDDADTLITDAESFFEGLSERAQESDFGGRVQEFLGHLEEAEQAIDDAWGYLKTLLTGLGCKPNLEDAICSLDRACECLIDAFRV